MFMFFLFIRYSITAASTLPQRVPMGTPSSGVKPIEVSTERPPLTAEMEEPLPRWQVTTFKLSSFSRPRYFAASCETNI